MRFEKTYKAVTQGVYFPAEELISIDSSIPQIHEIEMELSQATSSYNGKGKMIVDKKPDGGKSPNLADAIMMCFNPKIHNGIFGSGALLPKNPRQGCAPTKAAALIPPAR
jgi:hypothetical protein